MRCIGFRPAQDNHLDHLEKALARTAAQAAALIEQSKWEIERSSVLLKGERRGAGGAQVPV
jgi:hypothetical protein